MKVLLVEDEKRMAQALTEILRQENYDVDVCHDGNTGLDSILSDLYDVAIIDVMLPARNGFSLVQSARKDGIRTPILMLTAKSDLDDKVTGLDCGADDYLTKPFMTKELLARLRALCRRTFPFSDGYLQAGDLLLNPNTSVLSCKTTGQEIRLSAKELHIMEYMISNKGQIVSREQLALKIWGYDNNAEYNNVEVYLSFTRKKLTFIGSHTEIKSVRGLGYELRTTDV